MMRPGIDPPRRMTVCLLTPALCLALWLACAGGAVARTGDPPRGPCASATPACAEWVALGSGEARAMVYRSYPLGVPDPSIRRALVIVHGTLRNPDHYYRTAMAAAFLAGAWNDTIVIAPAFRSAAADCGDKLAPHEVSWSCHGDSWRSGGQAVSDPGLSSFAFMDQILRRLADKSVFPNLGQIVVAGHSAGGQFVARYQMANHVHESLGVPVTYVVANPSSYAWPDVTRPLPVGDGAPGAALAAWKDEEAHTRYSFGPFDAAKVPGYDKWPYGVEGRTGPYTASTGDDQLRSQLIHRPTTYMLGQVDTLPLGGFDDSPEAMAQGVTRRQRGEAFVAYVDGDLGGKAALMIVPECGHNDRCMFTTDTVLPVLFPPVE
jgi:pimeloyl-ACP methyl ester carboxylesterase